MSDNQEISRRVEKVEEHCAFAERTVEQLSEEIRVLNERVRQMVKRMETLERMLENGQEKEEQGGGDALD